MMQMQTQALLTATRVVAAAAAAAEGPNVGSNIKVAKLLIFSRKAEKVEGFITACRLYLRMKMREAAVEEQI